MAVLLARPWAALAAALVIEAALLTLIQGDFVAGDALWYADIAHNLARDPASVLGAGDTHPFVMRIGLTLPLAGLYALFGVTPFVTNLPVLVAGLGVLLVVYAAAPTPRAKLLGLGFGIACVPLWRSASLLNVDLPCAAMIGWSILLLSRRGRPRGAAYVAGAVAVWFGAFLIKETALWCMPIWLYAIACDVRAAGWHAVARRYAPAIGLGAALAGGYLALCAIVWGSPWARFEGIGALTYEHQWSLHGQPAVAWLHRLTWQVPLLLATLFGAALVPAAAAPWLVRGAARLWVVATATLLALYWFGSASLSAYTPLPISGRMIVPVLPGVLVLAALGTDAALERARGLRWRTPAAAALAVTVLALAAIETVRVARDPRPFGAVFAALRADVDEDPARRVVVVCDHVPDLALGAFYFGLEPPAALVLTTGADFAAAAPPPGARVRAIVRPRRAGAVARAAGVLGLPVLRGDHHVELLDAGDGARLHETMRAETK